MNGVRLDFNVKIPSGLAATRTRHLAVGSENIDEYVLHIISIDVVR